MSPYYALMILGESDAPLSLQQIASRSQYQQADAESFSKELEAARGEGLVTCTGGVWKLTDRGCAMYVE